MAEAPVVICPNCGVEKSGEFCSSCGQNSRDYLKGAHRIAGELIGETFELDSRLLRTLRYLLLSPGFLTNEFSRGRRARYVSPARLYLVISLVFFFLLSITSVGINFEADPDVSLKLQLDDTSTAAAVRSAERLGEQVDGAAPPPDMAGSGGSFSELLEAQIRRMALEPARAYREFLDKLPLTLFLLVPVFALLLKLVIPRRYYSEHLVFALHLHCFAFLVFSILLLLPEQGRVWIWIETALQVGCLVYIFLAFRRSYGLSMLGIVLRGGVVTGTYLFVSIAALVGALVATVYLY